MFEQRSPSQSNRWRPTRQFLHRVRGSISIRDIGRAGLPFQALCCMHAALRIPGAAARFWVFLSLQFSLHDRRDLHPHRDNGPLSLARSLARPARQRLPLQARFCLSVMACRTPLPSECGCTLNHQCRRDTVAFAFTIAHPSFSPSSFLPSSQQLSGNRCIPADPSV